MCNYVLTLRYHEASNGGCRILINFLKYDANILFTHWPDHLSSSPSQYLAHTVRAFTIMRKLNKKYLWLVAKMPAKVTCVRTMHSCLLLFLTNHILVLVMYYTREQLVWSNCGYSFKDPLFHELAHIISFEIRLHFENKAKPAKP